MNFDMSDREQADYIAENLCIDEDYFNDVSCSDSDDEPTEKTKRKVGRPKKTDDQSKLEKFDPKLYYKKYYRERPEEYYKEEKRADKIRKARERYAKKKEEEYKATHDGSLEGYKGVRFRKSKYLDN